MLFLVKPNSLLKTNNAEEAHTHVTSLVVITNSKESSTFGGYSLSSAF
jgi:hypothetical protein